MRLIDADALTFRDVKVTTNEIDIFGFGGYLTKECKGILQEEIWNAPTINAEPHWIPCKKELPNENEIFYNGVGIDNERNISDRVLAIDSDGFIRTGYFMKSCSPHEYYGNGIRDGYSSPGIAEWSFGEHYMGDPNSWVCGNSLDIVAWMPLPKPYRKERKDDESE